MALDRPDVPSRGSVRPTVATPAALIAGALFGAAHLGSHSLDAIPVLACFGIIACLVYEGTGSLLPSIGSTSWSTRAATNRRPSATQQSPPVVRPRRTHPPRRRIDTRPSRCDSRLATESPTCSKQAARCSRRSRRSFRPLSNARRCPADVPIGDDGGRRGGVVLPAKERLERLKRVRTNGRVPDRTGGRLHVERRGLGSCGSRALPGPGSCP